MPSSAYKLFERAITSRKQILCTYGGYFRELCPVILGHTNGQEMALAFQFAGQSKSGLPPGGEWKCLSLSKVSEITLRDGPWHAGANHTSPQRCVQEVDLDVNPASLTTQNANFTRVVASEDPAEQAGTRLKGIAASSMVRAGVRRSGCVRAS